MNEPPENEQSDHPMEGNPTIDADSEARIGRILRKTQRNVATRDVLTFTLGRAWSVLLVVGATFVVVADQWAKNGGKPESNDE